MNDSNNPAACTQAAFRPIVLLQSDGQGLASPAKGECSAGRGFAPFFLSLPPKSLVDWMVVAGHRFWRQEKRCMARGRRSTMGAAIATSGGLLGPILALSPSTYLVIFAT
jgi:hypothetical protein